MALQRAFALDELGVFGRTSAVADPGAGPSQSAVPARRLTVGSPTSAAAAAGGPAPAALTPVGTAQETTHVPAPSGFAGAVESVNVVAARTGLVQILSVLTSPAEIGTSPTTLSRRTADEPPAPAPSPPQPRETPKPSLSLLVSEGPSGLQIVAAAAEPTSEVKARLRSALSDVVTQLGRRLGSLQLNGQVVEATTALREEG
jgi:hypothetical protein